MHTRDIIFQQLEAMGTPRDSVVMMHSSLRLIGAVEGGARGLLDLLIEYFTGEGGLFCVPAHTWGNLGKPVPTLDLTRAESNLGTFPRLCAADPRALRSENPTHSVVVFGDRRRAEAFLENEGRVTTPTSPESCYGKLCTAGGFVLLAGVDQSKNTCLHAVAEILKLPNRMASTPTAVSVKRADGVLLEKEIYLYDCDYTDDISWRFPQYEVAFRYHGAVKDGFLGGAPAQLCDAGKMKDVVEMVWKRAGVDPLAKEAPLPPKWFVCER